MISKQTIYKGDDLMVIKIVLFIIGLAVGSFLNVCICRIPDKKSLAYPSHCSKCQHKFDLIELIPILGYIIYNRKCKYCGEKISFQNPLVELITAVVFLLLYNQFNLSLYFIEYAFLSSLLIAITFIDLERQEIPDELIVIGLIAGLLFNIYDIKANMINGILGFLLGGGVFLIIAMITQGAMGGGDIKLMAVLGLFMGWRLIIAITLISFILGAFVSIILIAAKLKNKKDYIPFGPFIAIAAVTAIFFGQYLVQIYMNNIQG